MNALAPLLRQWRAADTPNGRMATRVCWHTIEHTSHRTLRPTMTVEPSATPAMPISPSRTQAVLMADLVEYVRLVQLDPADTIARWSAFVEEVVQQVAPARGGRFIRSEGDSLLLVFDQAPAAAAAALDLHRRLLRFNEGRSSDRALQLRVGLDWGDVHFSPRDIHGAPVNIANRLMGLAAPGETWISVELRDHLVPGIDPDTEDLGDMHLKHVAAPVRAFRLGPRSAAPGGVPSLRHRLGNALRPGIAVLPLEPGYGDDPGGVLGEALADELIAHLARSHRLHVISGLSTRAMRGRRLAVDEISTQLGAAYLVSGRYRALGDKLSIQLTLTSSRDGGIAWSETFEYGLHSVFEPESGLTSVAVPSIARAIVEHEVQRAQTQPLPTLESYSLLFGAITLMHRASVADFKRSRTILDELALRHARSGLAHAWIAKWHVLRAVQGWTVDPEADTRDALDHSRRAVDADPGNSMALAIGGLAHGYLRKDLATAGRMYGDALDVNPNEPFAWLFSSTWHAYRGEAVQAEEAALMSLRLSPLDPLSYFYDSLAATALLAGGHWQRSEELARRSIRANRAHASTWRTLAYALVMLGRMDPAREAVARLQAIEPGYTVSQFRRRFPGRDGPMTDPWAEALRAAGLPD